MFPEKLPPGLPPSRVTDHVIELNDPKSRPPSHRVYRMGPADDLELKKQIDELLALGHIEHAKRKHLPLPCCYLQNHLVIP